MKQLSRRQLATFLAERMLAGKLTKKTTYATAAYLLETKQVNQLDLLLSDVAYELEQRGHAEVSVTSAHPLTERLRTELKAVLKQETGAQHVALRESIDESLLGGMVAKTADKELDYSVRGKLMRLEN